MVERARTTPGLRRGAFQALRGFTLIEMIAVLTIAALLLVAAAPSSVRLYDALQYRAAVRDVISLLGTARYLAVNTGDAQDVVLDPRAGRLQLNEEQRMLPRGVNLVVHTAKEINRDDKGIIRFYPEGGSSGGDLQLEREGNDAVRISVDWLMGGITHERYALK